MAGVKLSVQQWAVRNELPLFDGLGKIAIFVAADVRGEKGKRRIEKAAADAGIKLERMPMSVSETLAQR